KPGDIICIKKTKCIDNKSLKFQEALETILEDYFVETIADSVYAPQVFDMSIINDIEEPKHNKCYLLMQVIPKNTGTVGCFDLYISRRCKKLKCKNITNFFGHFSKLQKY